MSEELKTRIEEILSEISDPWCGRPLLSGASLRGIGVEEDSVSIQIQTGYPTGAQTQELEQVIATALQAEAAIGNVLVTTSCRIAAHAVQNDLKPHPGIKNIIVVASAKGGVGKSTVAANLALSLQAAGARTGVLDADIYGPSQPQILGATGRPDVTSEQKLVPKQAHGIKMMSIGFLVESDTPMIWRGPMVTSALQQLLTDTTWGDLDYLVIDMPPGTGDIQLTLAQNIPVSGAVIITTPQDIALIDARRGLKMFQRVNIPVLGVVENMSTHICTNCGHEEALFGAGGGERMAKDFGIPLLGQVPLDIKIRSGADDGNPTVVSAPDSEPALRYRQLALRTALELARLPRDRQTGLPNIVVQSG